MFARLVFVSLSIVVWSHAYQVFEKGEWDHEHQERWSGICRSGKKQSPVELEPAERDSADRVLYMNYTAEHVTLVNTGKTLKLVFEDPTKMRLSHVPNSDDVFYMEECRFRFSDAAHSSVAGKSLTRGSEHIIGEDSFELEMQCFHYNSKYANLEEAKVYEDGVVAMSTMFEPTHNGMGGDDELRKIIEHVVFVIPPQTTYYEETYLDMIKAAAPLAAIQYYHYFGSMTEPDCEQSVVWIISRYPRQISDEQMQLLRSIKRNTSHVIGKNHRYPQALYDRKTYRTFTASSYTSQASLPPAMCLGVVLGLLVVFAM